MRHTYKSIVYVIVVVAAQDGEPAHCGILGGIVVEPARLGDSCQTIHQWIQDGRHIVYGYVSHRFKTRPKLQESLKHNQSEADEIQRDKSTYT